MRIEISDDTNTLLIIDERTNEKVTLSKNLFISLLNSDKLKKIIDKRPGKEIRIKWFYITKGKGRVKLFISDTEFIKGEKYKHPINKTVYTCLEISNEGFEGLMTEKSNKKMINLKCPENWEIEQR